MLETIIVIVLVLWLLGLVAGQTFGGILHTLLLVALVVFVIRILSGRRAV
ncbi:MAG: lmo0937 family membrane protein [Blastocatellia bacterium]|nr:lmo0937 family membrane protein [Chloracidobacterium sp.]MBL8184595.1 lmo0937 family membrane protein [Blastocatellia bacterium]HBE84081.1 lmo0937 family membrane protein [Blastocatellia bacterium]HRJ87137.1 lmo0937 family membrane protein [Pyrinomonadaceae bacterium]